MYADHFLTPCSRQARLPLLVWCIVLPIVWSGCINDSSVPRPDDNEIGSSPDVMILEEPDAMAGMENDVGAGEAAGEAAGESAGETAGEAAGEAGSSIQA